MKKLDERATHRLALRSKEAAEALGIDPRTLRRWQQEEDLPFARVGNVVLFPVVELRAWLAERIQHECRSSVLVKEIIEDLQE